VLSSTKIDDNKLSHPSSAQRKELLSVIDRYPECFSETPGFCGQLEHEIILSPDFRPKRLKPYKIPEKLKPEVDKQILELLKLRFIHESKSPICAMKRDKSVRCVVLVWLCFKCKVGNSSAMAAPDCLSRMGPDDDKVK